MARTRNGSGGAPPTNNTPALTVHCSSGETDMGGVGIKENKQENKAGCTNHGKTGNDKPGFKAGTARQSMTHTYNESFVKDIERWTVGFLFCRLKLITDQGMWVGLA